MRYKVCKLPSLVFATIVQFNILGQAMSANEFRDCPQCPEMVVLPEGNFLMGSSAEESLRENTPQMGLHDISAWERPRHQIRIDRAFAIGKYEVTREEFSFFISDSGYRPGRNCSTETAGDERKAISWEDPGFPQTPRDPVVCVSWTDAHAYVDWLSKLTGEKYRLPSEAEWEYAARAGSNTARYWGDGFSDACKFANAADQSHLAKYEGRTFLDVYAAAGGTFSDKLAKTVPCNDSYAETAPVGSFEPNAFGLFDTLGNVWESVEDCAHFGYEGAPLDGSAWMDKASCDRAPSGFSELVRIFRGGSFSYAPYGLRSARRGIGGHDRRTWNRGFRVAKDLDANDH